jgi:hypothetical protein
MLLHDLPGYVAHVLVADAAVIGSLWSGVAAFRKAQRSPVLVKEVLLLETNP